MSVAEDEAALKELPYYKSILKTFLKKQIGALLEELSLETGEESIIVMADSSSRTASCLASNKAKNFFRDHTDITNEFLSYCISGFRSGAGGNSRTPKTAKRKTRNGTQGGNSSKQRKLNDYSSTSATNSEKTESGGPESGRDSNEDSTLGGDKKSESTQTYYETNSLRLFKGISEDKKDKTKANSITKNDFDDTIKIKIEPLSDTDTMDDASNISIKTEPGIDHDSQILPHAQGVESVDMNVTQNEQSLDTSRSQTPSPGATQTIGPIRYVRKFPPKDRTTLSLPEKIQIIQEFEMSGKATSQRKLADKYNISKSAVADMLKNRQLLKEHYEINANTKRKRFNTNSKFAEVNELVWQWFKTSRENGVQMSGPMIQEKALQIAQNLQAKDFKGSNGWLHSWRSRYNVTSYKDDNIGTPKLNYINDYSKVEGLVPGMQSSDTTNAIMNIGAIGTLVNAGTASNEQGAGSHTNCHENSNTSHIGNVNLRNKRSEVKFEIESVTAIMDNTVKVEQDLSNVDEVNRVAKAYDKIVENALSEYKQLN